MSSVLDVLAQADGLQTALAVLLLLMSIATWYLVFTKASQVWLARRRGERFLAAFRERNGDVATALAHLPDAAHDEGYRNVALAVRAVTVTRRPSAEGATEIPELVALAGRRATRRAVTQLQSGLSILASIGATAPFIGLFGTVWGIYHALIGIGLTGQATIDHVAGPVGEALIMTAFGLAVAIPAVLAYNFFVRASRTFHEGLTEFAQDLYAGVIAGTRISDDAIAPAVADRAGIPKGAPR